MVGNVGKQKLFLKIKTTKCVVLSNGKLNDRQKRRNQSANSIYYGLQGDHKNNILV